jgi:hypothetical protein
MTLSTLHRSMASGPAGAGGPFQYRKETPRVKVRDEGRPGVAGDESPYRTDGPKAPDVIPEDIEGFRAQMNAFAERLDAWLDAQGLFLRYSEREGRFVLTKEASAEPLSMPRSEKPYPDWTGPPPPRS